MAIERNKGVVVQSVARALEIIACFEDSAELGISQLSELMGLSKSTIYGLTNTLVSFGYLEQCESKKYRLGLRMFELGNMIQRRMDVRQEARPWCQILAEKYCTTVHLAAHSDGEIIYIDKVDSSNSVVVYSQVGKRAPMYCTGVGKAILAHLPHEEQERYIRSCSLTKMTEHTISTAEQLREELKIVHMCGYAIDSEEIELGLQCIAAPIFNYRRQPQMAISVSFPYGRLHDVEKEEVVRDVLQYAEKISERIGYMR